MKNISLVLIAFILMLTFTAVDVVEKGNKPEQAKKCPYLESLQQNNSQLQCPYLKGLKEGESSCPFLNGEKDPQSGCPYLNGNLNECPHFHQQDNGSVKQLESHPLPAGKNT